MHANADGPQTARDWKFDWLTDWQEVLDPEHLASWQAMCERPDAWASPFMHPALVRAWLDTFRWRETAVPFFLRARHGQGQEVRWLLVRPRTGAADPVRRLVPAGDGPGGPYFAYNDPLAAPSAAPGRPLADGFWRAFEEEIGARAGRWFDVCSIHRLRPECLDPGAGAATAFRAPYVRLDAWADVDAYLEARPRGFGSQLRRKLRRLERQHDAGLVVHRGVDLDAALACARELDTRRLRRYPGSVLPAGYLERIVRNGAASGLAVCSELRIDGAPASWRLDYRLGDTLYLAECTFDERFARHSPGQVHALMLLRRHVAEGGRVYDALLGTQAYKYDWTDGAEHALRSLSFRSGAPASVARRGLARLARRVFHG